MMLLQSNFAQSFQSPLVRIFLVLIALGLLYVLWREVRRFPRSYSRSWRRLSSTWSGVLMIFPLLPFYVKTLGGSGINILGFHFGIGIIAGFIIASFTVAQLLSAPMWGKFSDRVGRRPTLLIALTASGDRLSDLWLCRFALAVIAVANRAGSRRRDCRSDSGLRRRFNRATGSRTCARLAFCDDKSRRNTWTSSRLIRHHPRQTRSDAGLSNTADGPRRARDHRRGTLHSQHRLRGAVSHRVARSE